MATTAPPRKLTPAEEVSLQQAGQYSGRQGQDILTPANAQNVGLDPQQGFINPDFGVSQPSPASQSVATTLQQAGSAGNVNGSGPLGTDSSNSPEVLPGQSSPVTAQPVTAQTEWSPVHAGAIPVKSSTSPAISTTEKPPVGEQQKPPVGEQQKEWSPVDAGAIPVKPSVSTSTGTAEQPKTEPLKADWTPVDAGAILVKPGGEQPTGQVSGAPTGAAAQPWGPPPPPPLPPQLPVTQGASPGTFDNPATGSTQPLQTQPGGQPIDQQDQIAALTAAGYTPGQAQAVAAGKIPKTLSGNTPAPPKTVAPSTPAPVDDLGKLGDEDLVNQVLANKPAQAATPATPATPPPPPAPSASDQAIRAANEQALANPPKTTQQTTTQQPPAEGSLESRVVPGASLEGVDPRISEIITAAAQALPPGYTVTPTSGLRGEGQGQHTKGKAADFQIIGPDGKPVVNKGEDTTGLYTLLAKNAYGYQEKYHPELTGQFQWGGQFGTSTANDPNNPDLMHFDIGGRRGRITRYSRETIGSALPPVQAAVTTPGDVQTALQINNGLGGLLKDKGSVYVAMGKKYGVDPRLMAAMSMEETGNGTSHLLRTRNNVGGITGPGHSGAGGDYMPYNSIDEGIEAEASLLRHGYIGQGLDTIEKIGNKWAPPGAFNDPDKGNAGWPAAVRKFYAALGGSGKLGEVSGKFPVFGGSTAKGGSPKGSVMGDQPAAQPENEGGSVSYPQMPSPQRGGGGGGGGYSQQGGPGGTPSWSLQFNQQQVTQPQAAQPQAQSQEAPPLQPQRMSVSTLLPDQNQQNPMVAALTARGFTPQQAQQFALSSQTIAPGKGIGPLNLKEPPPPAPTPATQLSQLPATSRTQLSQLPAPSGIQLNLTQKQPVTPQILPTKQLMPSFQAQAPKVDPSVVLGLMKKGFTREQAIAVAGKATVSPGIGQTASFRPQAQAPAAPGRTIPSGPAIQMGSQQPLRAPLSPIPKRSSEAPPPVPSTPPAKPQEQPVQRQIEAHSGNMRPLGYKAAVQLPSGEVHTGSDHDRAYHAAGSPREQPGLQFGFADKKGKFVTMDEADKILEKHQKPSPSESTAGIASAQAYQEKYTGRPAGSTQGDPNPPGMEALTGPLKDQGKQHKALLSPDDPRVSKQPDGYIKGEHFVEGDPYHESLLNGLPYGKGGPQRQKLAQGETAIADKSPMHISYISSPKELEKFPTRESRRIQYEKSSPEARLMKATEGALVGHSMIPTSVGVKLPTKAEEKEGETHQGYMQGISTNVMANNFQHINDKLQAMGRKTPYKELGTKFANDLEGYYSNLLAGHTATGRGYAIGTEDHPNTPDREHVPYKLTRKEADFINLVINNTSAFAAHDDAKKIRELARANGTLITEKGETNQLAHDIEQIDPGWHGRDKGGHGRVLEPSIKTFKTGLIHEIHPSEQHLPDTIRPGKEYQQLTKALARTSQRGRPDIPIGASLHHTFQDNKAINDIERDFSDHKIDEAAARERLHALGEDPDDYRFVGGSGGLITPYEDDPEALTPEEHTTMKQNLRQAWVGGKMNVEDYRKKSAEVPLPSKPSKPATPKPVATTAEPVEAPEAPPVPKPLAPKPPKPPKPQTPPSDTEPEEAPEIPAPAPKPQPKPKAPKPQPIPEPEAPEEPTEAPPIKAPAPDEPLPPVKKVKAVKPAAVIPPPVVKEPEVEEKLTKPEGATKDGKPNKAWMEDPKNEAERQSYLEKRVAASLKRQNTHPSAIPLKVQRNEAGGVQHDPSLNPVWEKTDYNIADTPFLQKHGKGLSQLEGADKHEDTLGEDEHKHLIEVERKRLSAMRNASAVHTMGDHIVNSYNKIKDIPEIAAGKGWYSRMRDKMAKVFGAGEEGKASEDHELFAQLLGATSAKTPVRDNFIQALDAFEQYKAGKFDRHIAKYKEAYQAMQDGGYKALNQKMREQGLKDEDGNIRQGKSDADAMAHWIDHHKIRPLKQNGAKYNSNSDQVLKVLAGTWLSEVGSPKTPNFAGNLTGRTLQATIDVWAARHLHRIAHEHDGEKKGWRPQSSGEPGVNSLDFAFSQDAMKHAADKIGINPDDLQAILWYAEKQHYDKHGWTGAQGAEKGSFDETWDKAFPTEGKAMTSQALQKHYQDEKARDDKLDDLRSKVAEKRGKGESEQQVEKYMKRYADEFLSKHGYTREHLEAPPAAPGLEEAA